MSQLIQMRQRIKAIETIKKVTQAMRIISMSTHTRLKKKVEALAFYKKEIQELFVNTSAGLTNWQNQIINPNPKISHKTLAIIVTSQKGLSGSFNYALFEYFNRNKPDKNFEIITIGKKSEDFIKKTAFKLITGYDSLSSQNISFITNDIFEKIFKANQPYSSVIIYSNISKGFFTQRPQHFVLIPLVYEKKLDSGDLDEYIWEQSSDEVLNILANLYIKTSIHELLLQSLLAEQAARFISMNSSTQNAENMLTDMTLQYNKLRQAKITKDLTDLSGSFQSD